MGSVNEIRFSFLCKSLDILKNSLLTSKKIFVILKISCNVCGNFLSNR